MTIMQFMPEFGLAGAETMCENLTYELINKGHKVIVVSLYDYHSPITQRIEEHNIPLLYLGKKPGLDLSIIKKIRNVIEQYQPDILHTHRYLLKYVALASVGLPVKGIVHTVHNIAQKENNAIDRNINKFFFSFKKIIPVALSNQIKSTILDVYNIEESNIPVIFNGVPLLDNISSRTYENGKHIRLIHVGRFTDVKNHLALLQAITELHALEPNIILDLYGAGELKAEIDSFIAEHQASDYIFDNGLTDNIREKLNESDIFILPSKYEGMPMTIIEAMGAGLPIIASRVGGIPDMIDDGVDGILCELDKESIKTSLLKVIHDKDLRMKIGSNALGKAEKFSAKHMADSYEKLYSTFSNNS